MFRYSVGSYQGKRTHTQLVRKHSATVVSAHWATMNWAWSLKKSGTGVRELISTHKKKKKKKRRQGMNRQAFPPNPCKRGKCYHHHHVKHTFWSVWCSLIPWQLTPLSGSHVTATCNSCLRFSLMLIRNIWFYTLYFSTDHTFSIRPRPWWPCRPR